MSTKSAKGVPVVVVPVPVPVAIVVVAETAAGVGIRGIVSVAALADWRADLIRSAWLQKALVLGLIVDKFPFLDVGLVVEPLNALSVVFAGDANDAHTHLRGSSGRGLSDLSAVGIGGGEKILD